MPNGVIDKLRSSDKGNGFGRIWNRKTLILTLPWISCISTHLQIKTTLTHTANKLTRHANENKQFWPILQIKDSNKS